MKRVFLVIFLIAAALCTGLSAPIASLFSPQLSLGSFSVAFPFALEEQEARASDEKIAIRFVGDVMLARNVELLMRSYGSAYPYQGLPPLPPETYLVGNFEGAVPRTHVPTPAMHFSFSVDPQYLSALHAYGFTHLNLANNHSFDFGADDLANTEQMLAAASTTPFGYPGTAGTSSVAYADIGSSRVALIGLYAVDRQPTAEELAPVLARAASSSDLQIAYIHWGDEYVLEHNDKQEALAHTLIDLGADAVIGHHPHVVQDIGEYNGAPVFYSLGNFIFDQYFSEDVEKGLMLELTIEKGKPVFALMPITSIGSRSAPRPMAEYERDIFLAEIASRSDAKLRSMIKEGKLFF
jgi:poly-gamma-glutamate synthesis protein (capsule biosynthesis protein)